MEERPWDRGCLSINLTFALFAPTFFTESCEMLFGGLHILKSISQQ